MTDIELIQKRLAFIVTCIAELRTMSDITAMATNVRERRFVEHTLQLAIQAALDIASHIVSNERIGEPNSNKELFDLLAMHDWIPTALTENLRNMAGFRNAVVHGYLDIRVEVLREIVTSRLTDLEVFVFSIRERLQPPQAG